MISLPYGNGRIEFDEVRENAAVRTSGVSALRSETPGTELVRAAMAAPYGGTRLSELARGASRCTLIISDHTRPVPSQDILPPML